MEIPNQHFIPMRLRDWFAPVTVIALEACISSEAADTADAGEANRRVTGGPNMDLRTEVGRVSNVDLPRPGRVGVINFGAS
jgi:hypothetical protein